LYRGTSTTTLCPEISIASSCSGNACFATGDKRLSAVVKDTGTPGSVVSSWLRNDVLHLACGCVRGAVSNDSPYRDLIDNQLLPGMYDPAGLQGTRESRAHKTAA
jgi:hypothetical protein